MRLALHPLQLFLEWIAAISNAPFADEARTALVAAQVANAAHVLSPLHRLDKLHLVAMGARKRVQFARARRWTRDDRISLRLSHYSANISVTTTVEV